MRPDSAPPWLACAALAAALFTAAPVRADDGPGTTEDRVRRLEAALAEQAAQTDRLRREFDAYRRDNPARGPSADELAAAVAAYDLRTRGADVAVAATGAPAAGVRWGGYFHWRYLDGSRDASLFDQHRLVLTADAAVSDCIDVAMEVEFEHGGISDEIEGEVVLERGELRFRLSDAFVAKVGWLLVPFGRFNLHHDDPFNDLTDRPFTARFLVPTGFGQPGIGLEGAVPFGCGHVLSYDAIVSNGYRDAFTADEGVREARQAEDENDGKQAWARVAVAWDTHGALDRLETGLSGTYGIYDARNENAVTGFAVDALVRKGPFELKGEYVAYDYERNASDPAGAIRGQSGLWVEGAWHFFPCPWRDCRSCLVTDTSLFTLVARWQTMDLDDDVRGSTFQDDLAAFTLGLNYRVTERTVLRVDHTWFDADEDADRTLWALSVSTFF